MASSPRTLPAGIVPRRFLRDYWQKRPLLIRSAFPNFDSPVSRAELFTLARNTDVESRLVLEKSGAYPWQLQHGPFSAQRLRRLPKSHWSLLVQGVNFHLPSAARLLERFSFIPNWRVDDLMISYATDQGGVGPHLDSYDVFLLQASGQRRWRISDRAYTEADLLPDMDLRILRNFKCSHEWVLNPGDMLYLPPGIAHHGIAMGESITCSIGFRAPSDIELVEAWLDTAGTREIRLTDPNLPLQTHAGEITPRQRNSLRQLIRNALPDDANLDRWLGRHLTQLPALIPPPVAGVKISPATFLTRLQRGEVLSRSVPSRGAFFRGASGNIQLFINGLKFQLPAHSAALAATLTGPGEIRWTPRKSATSRHEAALLLTLYRAGLVRFPD